MKELVLQTSNRQMDGTDYNISYFFLKSWNIIWQDQKIFKIFYINVQETLTAPFGGHIFDESK